MTIKEASNAKALHHTIPSALDGRSSVDGVDVLLELLGDNVFFILFCLKLYDKIFSLLKEEDDV